MEDEPAITTIESLTLEDLPPRSKWPRIDSDVQTYLVAFLEGYKREAARALKAAVEVNSYGDPNRQSEGIVKYWQNVINTLNWLQGRVPAKQRWLAEMAVWAAKIKAENP